MRGAQSSSCGAIELPFSSHFPSFPFLPRQVSLTMDTFERQFESLDVQAEFVEQAMASSTASSTPADQVETLMQQIAEEHGLELQSALPSAARPAAAAAPAAAVPAMPAAPVPEAELERRLGELRGRG